VPKNTTNDRLIVITINVSQLQIDMIERLRIRGLVASRSEYCRELITRGLKEDIDFLDHLETYMENGKEFILVPGHTSPFKIERRLE
jgi:hypothetical protein